MTPKDVMKDVLFRRLSWSDGSDAFRDHTADLIIAELKKHGWEIRSADNRHRVGGVSEYRRGNPAREDDVWARGKKP